MKIRHYKGLDTGTTGKLNIAIERKGKPNVLVTQGPLSNTWIVWRADSLHTLVRTASRSWAIRRAIEIQGKP